MTYDLFIGDRLFSSWSLRGWLMLEKFGLPYNIHMISLYGRLTGQGDDAMAREMAALAPARLVPALRTPEGTVIGETLTMGETLAERHPEAGLWPSDPAQRATARWLCAEMATGYHPLRDACPMQLSHQIKGFAPSEAVASDLARIETMWAHARAVSGADGDWLFGSYTLTEVFFTPIAARIIGYDLPISQSGRDYALAMLSDPAVQRWRTEALKTDYTPFPYCPDAPRADWPV